ncbi:23S ribosomal RNA methyltransferase Erm [Candidatus Dojkabacteria bacterium]|nr:23S ribosomal RNA methyltransferase Erm [Candidatus Dojkabacteria bacterium]
MYKYSQNNLKDKNLVRTLVSESSISSEDIVLDIGAGDGIITQELVKVCKKVIAIEIDPILCKKLRKKFRQYDNVRIVETDFLGYKLPERLFKVFSNIPYFITSDIVRKLTGEGSKMTEAYVVMQKEAADKFCGKPKECLFSILIKPFYELRQTYDFKKTDFYPVPSVESVLVRISRRNSPLINFDEIDNFRQFIGFCFKRTFGPLRKSLKKFLTYNQIKKLYDYHGIKRDAIPTDLTIEQWLGLFRFWRSVECNGS